MRRPFEYLSEGKRIGTVRLCEFVLTYLHFLLWVGSKAIEGITEIESITGGLQKIGNLLMEPTKTGNLLYYSKIFEGIML